MSGPKRGTWHIVYDPTPTRLADLGQFAARQDAWLERHGSFIGRYLGNEALARARAARDRVRECLAAGDPDSGFDAYGEAWGLFNQLHREATEAQRRRRLEEHARVQRAAAALADQCRETWESSENQVLLQRWVDVPERYRLAETLTSIGVGTAREVQEKARAWQNRFAQALRLAGRRAAENAREVKACVPALRSATRAVEGMNADVLPRSERRGFEDARARLHQKAEDALTREDLQVLQNATAGMKALVADYEPKIRAAQLKKATEVWRTALVNCGYGVALRTEPDGTMVIEASSFPMKAVNIRVKPDSEEVNLEVNGAKGHAGCVRDVQSLQAELARQGVELKMTDWGSGNPGSVMRHQDARISVGGAK
jgi:hypothetical protein